MEFRQRRNDNGKANIRRMTSLAGIALACISAFTSCSTLPAVSVPRESGYTRHTRGHLRNAMPASIRADHPAIAPVAAAIRAVTTDPLQQIVMVHDVTHLLVDYDDDQRVYGLNEFHATFDEMLDRRRQSGWLYLRDDCDGRAVFAAHLLAALGIPWRFEASYWKEHAWIIARVRGVEYDLLDLRSNASETNRVSYKVFGHLFVRQSMRPPAFAWRRAWAQNTSRNLQVGLALGLLTLDSEPGRERQRFATDWTARVSHGSLSPVDDRALTSNVAGFPYGEPLHASALAANRPVAPEKPAASPGVALGVATGSSASAEN